MTCFFLFIDNHDELENLKKMTRYGYTVIYYNPWLSKYTLILYRIEAYYFFNL